MCISYLDTGLSYILYVHLENFQYKQIRNCSIFINLQPNCSSTKYSYGLKLATQYYLSNWNEATFKARVFLRWYLIQNLTFTSHFNERSGWSSFTDCGT